MLVKEIGSNVNLSILTHGPRRNNKPTSKSETNIHARMKVKNLSTKTKRKKGPPFRLP